MTETQLKQKSISDLCRIAKNYKFSIKEVIIKAILEHIKNQKSTKNPETQKPETCIWSYVEWNDGDMWKGECGINWVVLDGTPKENGINFCPRCGRKLIEEEMTC